MAKKRKLTNNADEFVEKKESKVIDSNSMTTMRRLSNSFFDVHSCEELAQNLLGKRLCRRINETGEVIKGIVVETESYLGTEDVASQSYKGKVTPRNEPMFMKPGTCYVYFTYGMYHIFNVSSVGEGAAVLIRALQPLEGIETMQTFRKNFNKKVPSKKQLKEKQLCNGPAKLCIALNIEKNTINKVDATCSDLIWFEDGDTIEKEEIVVAPRIGINVAAEWKYKPLRFYIRNNDYVSVRDKKAELSSTT
ncbi:DNA-3-methyladenine glycosylase-like protein [Leptotrombidium deliense]|uniref:DNA-3-methyladenine glycosylase n=1 Tax=Leptotrombidium deliense TaxID=299467 RepID=A0A443S3G2_9ACAR|nr:DNA-3-methyladenine glycosylase-like protein [Leptotrombidium deliense]